MNSEKESGKYPHAMEQILSYLCVNGNDIDPNQPNEIRDALRDVFPSIDYRGSEKGELPYAFKPGVEIATQLGVHPHFRLKIGFTNVIFQKDEEGYFNRLPSEWQKIVLWMYLANFGSFRQIFIPYSIQGEEIKYSLYLNTLEGGRPKLSIEELSRRLRALGSAIELGGYRELEGYNIPYEEWEQLREVRALIDLGAFCGREKYKLLSPPIKFEHLVRNPDLVRLETKLAKYSNQAEGAFQSCFYHPELARALGLPFDFILFSTRSGQFGVIKTDLKPEDFSPVGKFFEGGVAGVIPIGGKVYGKPSVEAAELMETDINLASENPLVYTVKLRREGEGFVIDPNGEITAPIVARKLHFHRSVRINNPEKFIYLPMDVEEDPPSFCGGDLQKRHTEKYTRLAVEERKRRGNKALGVIIEMANHGCLVELFWDENDYRDPVIRFMEAVEKGEIEFFLPVEQR